MEKEYMTIEQLADIMKLDKISVRTYLGRGEFRKYEDRTKSRNATKIIFRVDKNFVEDFTKFLMIKKKFTCAKLLAHYFNVKQKLWADKVKIDRITQKEIQEKDLHTKALEAELNITSNHYKGLLERYKEVLLINKGYENILQQILNICDEDADNMAVIEIQKRIKDLVK